MAAHTSATTSNRIVNLKTQRRLCVCAFRVRWESYFALSSLHIHSSAPAVCLWVHERTKWRAFGVRLAPIDPAVAVTTRSLAAASP